MFGLLTAARLVFRLTPVGMIYTGLRTALHTVDHYATMAQLAEVKSLERRGINREEEKYHQDLHGGAEPVFPFVLSLSVFPAGTDAVVGEDFSGHFVWKLSEWNDLERWLQVTILNAVRGPGERVGRDGRWLIKIGRERWADKEWRKKALKNRDDHPKIVEAFDFMLRRGES